MKTAISIPDDVFHEADRLARRSRCSRSERYALALREYVARHAAEEVTEAMDRAIDALSEDTPDSFVPAAARSVLERSEW